MTESRWEAGASVVYFLSLLLIPSKQSAGGFDARAPILTDRIGGCDAINPGADRCSGDTLL